jgi:hypothetical protein
MGALKDEHNVTTQRIWEEDASFAGLWFKQISRSQAARGQERLALSPRGIWAGSTL